MCFIIIIVTITIIFQCSVCPPVDLHRSALFVSGQATVAQPRRTGGWSCCQPVIGMRRVQGCRDAFRPRVLICGGVLKASHIGASVALRMQTQAESGHQSSWLAGDFGLRMLGSWMGISSTMRHAPIRCVVGSMGSVSTGQDQGCGQHLWAAWEARRCHQTAGR